MDANYFPVKFYIIFPGMLNSMKILYKGKEKGEKSRQSNMNRMLQFHDFFAKKLCRYSVLGLRFFRKYLLQPISKVLFLILYTRKKVYSLNQLNNETKKAGQCRGTRVTLCVWAKIPEWWALDLILQSQILEFSILRKERNHKKSLSREKSWTEQFTFMKEKFHFFRMSKIWDEL